MARSGDGSAVLAAVDQTLPSLPRIKTKPPAEDGELLSEEEAAAGCVTPTSEEHRLKPATDCPPPPQKPPAAAAIKRRKTDEVLRVRRQQLVPRDLSLVFAVLPPKKRLRAAEPDQFF